MAAAPVTIADRLGPAPTPAGDVELTSADLEEFWQELFPDTYEGRRGGNAFVDAVRAHAEDGLHRCRTRVPTGRLAGKDCWLVREGRARWCTAGRTARRRRRDRDSRRRVAAIVPNLFDIEKVRLTPSQEYLLADLVGHREALDGTLTADELYVRLPAETRAEVSRLDFAEFLDACRRAGLADFGNEAT